MEVLDKEAARGLTRKLKKKFNLSFDHYVNFINYRVFDVLYKLTGDFTEDEEEIMVYQGDPFKPTSKIPAKEIVNWISANFPYDVTIYYGALVSGHYSPHAIIKCEQK